VFWNNILPHSSLKRAHMAQVNSKVAAAGILYGMGAGAGIRRSATGRVI
jgi:hypothetical protein